MKSSSASAVFFFPPGPLVRCWMRKAVLCPTCCYTSLYLSLRSVSGVDILRSLLSVSSLVLYLRIEGFLRGLRELFTCLKLE